MKFDISIIGYGVIGVESLFELTDKIKKKTKLNIAIIDKDLNNIPGGVAYSKTKSKFGFLIILYVYLILHLKNGLETKKILFVLLILSKIITIIC